MSDIEGSTHAAAAANNFNKIKCKVKYSVDPDVNASAIFVGTSDDFFILNKSMFSVFFIDGLHHSDQVKRDFENSLRCLNDGGFIVIHDCLPEREDTTHVPRDSKVWHGNVYKFCMNMGTYKNISYKTVDMDNGCMVIKKANINARWHEWHNVTWEYYFKNRREHMQIIKPVEIGTYL